MKKNNSDTIEGNFLKMFLAIVIIFIIGIASHGMLKEDRRVKSDSNIDINMLPITDSDMEAIEDYYLSRGMEPDYSHFPSELRINM